jgi:UDP-N-acetylmuramate dehydrogenase
LASDQGFEGVVIKSNRLNLKVEKVAHNQVKFGCSTPNSTVIRQAVREGWGGMEFLCGIPGAIGGAVWMNAGTTLGETKDRIQSVEVFSLETGLMRGVSGSELSFSYRKNHFLSDTDLVYSATFEVGPRDSQELQSQVEQYMEKRKSAQPYDLPSCGSVFKNPKEHSKLHAWQVIEKIGLRGYRVGNAQFSEKHCNFIVNHGGARAIDVKTLIELAKTKAESQLGILLEEEVKTLGEI